MVTQENGFQAQTDDQGNLIIPKEIASAYGIKPNAHMMLQKGINGLEILRPVTQISKLYIEVTNQCNLGCRTCMRNTWQEPMGMMSDDVFTRIIDGLRSYSTAPTVFFGGLGEPLMHPEIIDMVVRAKSIGCRVELITNGTLLTKKISRDLLEAGVDLIWVSIDGATPESYSDVRLGATLPSVIENISNFNEIFFANMDTESLCDCAANFNYRTKLGIAFVAMKRNINDLPAVLRLGQNLNVKRFMVTNLLPYTEEMCDETLYDSVVDTSDKARLSLPRIDTSKCSLDPILRVVNRLNWVESGPIESINHCPFIAKGTGAISWEGSLSPCLPLLHTYTSYVKGFKHVSKSWAVGNIKEHSLKDIWNTPEHIAFRERVQVFNFAPCTICGSCELLDKNEEDCYGNTFPTCGGCLWAQGIVQCP